MFNKNGNSIFRYQRFSIIFSLLLIFGCNGTNQNFSNTIESSWESEDSGMDSDPVEQETDHNDDNPNIIKIEEEEGCENLNPLYCGFPFPSDRYLIRDDSTVTGYRLNYSPEFLPPSINVEIFDFSHLERLDGMSPTTQIITLFEVPPDLSEAATYWNIGRSLENDSPTLIIDLKTGEKIAHWVEIDARTEDNHEKSVYLRLASHLTENRSYAVAFRHMLDQEGRHIKPFDAFRALRDGLETDSPEIESRKPGFEEMFDALERFGIERSELLFAWRFHTSSGESIRGDLLTARADALRRLGPFGLGCQVESVDDNYGEDGLTFRRILGTYTVPSYMEHSTPPTRYARGEDGKPVYVEDVEVDFTIIVPRSVIEDRNPYSSKPLVTLGIGLMGSAEDRLSSKIYRRFINRVGSPMVGTDWAGMSKIDAPSVATALTNVNQFVTIAERLQQGLINQIALTRTFMGSCSELDEFYYNGRKLVDTSEPFFVGDSLGGIFGGSLMTLSPDIERGVLLVSGAVFPFIMERSIFYTIYRPLFQSAYPDHLHRVQLLPLSQHLWDASEPAGYLHHLTNGLPNIGPKKILSITVAHDAHISNLASDQAMRMVGAPVLEGSARIPWGFEVASLPHSGSAYVVIDVGNSPVPETNVAPSVNENGHSMIKENKKAIELIKSFLFERKIKSIK